MCRLVKHGTINYEEMIWGTIFNMSMKRDGFRFNESYHVHHNTQEIAVAY